MKKRSIFGPLAAAAGMVALILDSATALAGAVEGVSLCIRTIVPSLFPFLFLSGTFSSGCGQPGRIAARTGKIFGIPNGAESILVPMFFGGYPVGAQCLGEMYRNGTISRNQAEKMLGYCSNVGPAFLFGILSAAFSSHKLLWFIWGIQILSIFITSRLFSPGGDGKNSAAEVHTFGMEQAVGGMLKICGWVILFRVLIGFLRRWFLGSLPVAAQVGLVGMLELSNGCCMLNQVQSEGLRFILCNGLLSFGGLCVVYQTASVCSGLRIQGYVIGKITQCAFCVLLAWIVYYRKWLMLLFAVGLVLIGKEIEKRVEIASHSLYNSQSRGGWIYAVSQENGTLLFLLRFRRKAGGGRHSVPQAGA